MNRQQKEQVIQSLRQDFEGNPASFVVSYRGLSVDQLQVLRRQLRKHGGRLKVTKVRLMKIAADQAEAAKPLIPYLKDQIGIVFASKESSAIAKVLYDFAKNHKDLQLIVGKLDDQLLDKDLIKRIASLPSREVLLAQVCGAINAPISGLASVLRILLMRPLMVLKQISEKK